MVTTQSWHCREFGDDGWVFVAVDQMQPCGTMIGMRRAVHPFFIDQNPALLGQTIAEMTELMGRLTAPEHPASRACAFGPGDEARGA